MLSIRLLILLAVGHCIGDFVLQSDWMALHKGQWRWPRWTTLATDVDSWAPLTDHAALVGFVMAVATWSPRFGIVTFACHLFTDMVTSQWTSKLWFARDVGEDPVSGARLIHWEMSKRHWFFVAIGVDQMLHAVQLVLTAAYVGIH